MLILKIPMPNIPCVLMSMSYHNKESLFAKAGWGNNSAFTSAFPYK